MTVAPLQIMAGLVLEDGRRWAEAATDVQLGDAAAVLSADEGPRRHWIGRSRGYSKTTDAAAMTLGAMLGGAIAPGERGFCCAADRDQARLLLNAIEGFAARTPALRGRLDIGTWRVADPATRTEVTVVAADAASAYGLLGSWFVIDELCQWADVPGSHRFWEAVSTAFPKNRRSRVMVITTAGDPGHFSRSVYDHAVESDQWRVSEVHGPPPWLDPDEIDAERARLPESTFRRLWLNEWAAPEDRLVLIDDLDACRVLTDWPLAYDHQQGPYVVALDIGLKNDHTALVVAHAEDRIDGTGNVVVLDRKLTWRGTRREPVNLGDVEAAVSLAVNDYGGATVVVDPWQAALLVERLRKRHITVEEHSFTSQSVGRLAQTLHLRLRDRGLRLPADDQDLADELANVQLRETSPGVYRLDHRAGRHDDQAVALGMACVWLANRANTWTFTPLDLSGGWRPSPWADLSG